MTGWVAPLSDAAIPDDWYLQPAGELPPDTRAIALNNLLALYNYELYRRCGLELWCGPMHDWMDEGFRVDVTWTQEQWIHALTQGRNR